MISFIKLSEEISMYNHNNKNFNASHNATHDTPERLAQSTHNRFF